MEGEAIDCLILPLDRRNLLVPSLLVAEAALDDPGGAPDAERPAFFGTVVWGGRAIPVVDFERLRDPEAPVAHARRIAILYTLTEGSRYPGYALRIRGVPPSVQVGPGDVQEAVGEEDGLGSCLLKRVHVAGITCEIPDLDAVERAVEGH